MGSSQAYSVSDKTEIKYISFTSYILSDKTAPLSKQASFTVIEQVFLLASTRCFFPYLLENENIFCTILLLSTTANSDSLK